MNSPFGIIGATLAHFHWTFEYLLWGITWVNVQLMLADMPRYDYGKPGAEKEIKFNSTEEMKRYFDERYT